jgi:hypothetical protein
MKIQWNKVTWYSKIAAVVLGIVIFALGIYIGIMYQRGLDALEWAEQLRIERPIPVRGVIRETEKRYGFVQEGNIKNNATGAVEADDWVLIYEKPGAPARSIGLVVTTDSRCVDGVRVGFCNTATFEQGQRARVMGHEDSAGTIVVERLEIIRY